MLTVWLRRMYGWCRRNNKVGSKRKFAVIRVSYKTPPFRHALAGIYFSWSISG